MISKIIFFSLGVLAVIYYFLPGKCEAVLIEKQVKECVRYQDVEEFQNENDLKIQCQEIAEKMFCEK